MTQHTIKGSVVEIGKLRMEDDELGLVIRRDSDGSEICVSGLAIEDLRACRTLWDSPIELTIKAAKS